MSEWENELDDMLDGCTEPTQPEPNLAKQLAASILVKRVERQVLPLLRAIRDANPVEYPAAAISELRLVGFAREAGKLIDALEQDTHTALHGGRDPLRATVQTEVEVASVRPRGSRHPSDSFTA